MSKNVLHEEFKLISESKAFNYFTVAVIVFSALLVGVSVDTPINSPYYPVINLLELFILAYFCIELVVRVLAEKNPLDFFKRPWDIFDFVIVLLCFIPFQSKAIYVLRIVRVLRTFRLFRAFPNLQPVVRGLVGSISSVVFVALLLLILIYTYAVIGVSLFSKVDPVHFGGLWAGLFTLFQIITLENWNTIMLPANSIYPLGGPLFFVSFIILGTMIVMNLFLGIIVGNMTKAMDKLNSPESMRDYLDEDAKREKDLSVRLKSIETKLNLLLKKRRKRH
jgi:voltage-gated sodium channel